jgi:hypothetical protein
VEYDARVFDLIFIPTAIPFEIIHLNFPEFQVPKNIPEKHQNSP